MSQLYNPHSEDQVLWNAFRAGDETAFGEIAKKYYKGLFSYGIRFSADREFVKDCIQDLFYEMWAKRETLGETGFVKFYLLKSLRRKIHRESSRRTDIFEDADLDKMVEKVGDVSIEQHIIEIENNEEQSQLLRLLIQAMPKRQQEVIHLRFYENLDNESIAQIMSISKQGVANLLYRTIRELKDRM
jgi:RNA polymerase sigma factor (sigma-70 family)